uniref:Uncharacterized protein n=1 Tax=Kalanchoe fedtschenkoi TaxID=63787 RepID=A0A7N1A8J9_KALFE
MDAKGITWFGNVEEAVCQDTMKYVKSQVQTVGASVKKFYSEVVDDLLSPPFMDPVKVSSLSCTGVHKKPKTVVPNSTEMEKATNLAAVISNKKPLCSGSLTFEKRETPADQMSEPQLESDTASWESKEIEGRDNNCTQENFRLKQTAADASVKAANIILSNDAVDGRSSENDVGSKSTRLTEAADNLVDILPADTSSGPNGKYFNVSSCSPLHSIFRRLFVI